MRPAALVVSPFASAPRDAGHRRRVHQMTRLLADRGYAVTFLLLAFEDDWAWAHDPELRSELASQWDDVIVVHAGEHVGRPPRAGTQHALDEWWDPALQATLANLATRRFFDVVVVHNVWLSKAFDFVHPASVKVLETHDLFWKRRDAFARIGVAPAFYMIERAAELFGLARADIVVTIQRAEARELLGLLDRRIANVPFYDNELHTETDAAADSFLSDGKVSFGFLASANPFNIHGANALLAALETEIADSFAPVEIVVGGSVGRHLRTRLPVRRLGRVPTEAGFYAAVDYAIAPVFEGTGFKIKTADALALGTKLLASAHAADGVMLDPSLVCATPAAMAAEMARIALRRPAPGRARAHVRRAREALRQDAARGEAQLLRAIAMTASPVLIDLAGTVAETAQGALRLQCWLGVVRILAERDPVILVLPQSVRVRIACLLPPGVRAVSAGEVAGCRTTWPRLRHVDAGAAPSPPLHPNVLWEGAAVRAREMWADTAADRAARAEDTSLLLLRGGGRAGRFDIGTVIAAVDADASDAVETWLLRLLACPPPAAGVACASAPPAIRQRFIDICALRDIAFHGLIDDAALAQPCLPATGRAELARRAAHTARAIVAAHGKTAHGKEPLCQAA